MDRAGAAELESMIESALARREPGADRRMILVDGFNVLHAVLLGKERDEGWWRREPRERLLRRVAGWAEGPDEIWVAFDGLRPAWSVWAEPVAQPVVGGTRDAIVHQVFVESADDWIVRRARRSPSPDRTVVVSGDRKVAGRARSAGCEIWTPWGFVARCPPADQMATTASMGATASMGSCREPRDTDDEREPARH